MSSNSVEQHTKLVVEALSMDTGGATLNRLSDLSGGSTSMTSAALSSLEAQGRARFEGGRWYSVPAFVIQQHSDVDRPEPDGSTPRPARVPAYLAQSQD